MTKVKQENLYKYTYIKYIEKYLSTVTATRVTSHLFIINNNNIIIDNK